MKKNKIFGIEKKTLINSVFIVGGIGILSISALLVWIATIQIPDFQAFHDRKIVNSTKIYDRTGEILLYDFHQDIKRTEVPFDEMGENIKHATIAIEDSSFYKHNGIRPTSIVRAILVDIKQGKLSQGGSTITQQIIKNTLLSSDKTLTRKLKEWVLAIKLDNALSKDEILAIYLNESPYGGSKYGIYEASQSFFGKKPKDLTIAESAYIAAMPQAPTFYSPYGKNKEKLNERKNTVLSRMKELGYIDDVVYQKARDEKVIFKEEQKSGIKAPHFVFFIKQYIEDIYGADAIEEKGLKIISTLDYSLQEKAEEIVLKYAKINEQKFKGKNASLVAVDPKTGQILVMVGSRDYFDKNIDGNFNIATAKRQPGSSFKPFVYATAFEKGYTPDTVLFDLPTEFQTTCDAYGNPITGPKSQCYMPGNFDDKFRGPISLRDALAQSINVPAVKLLYLAGIKDSIKTAQDMGIKTLGDANQYGLTLVLGGGEVSLLDMTSAYGGFATGGIRHPYNGILKVEDNTGNVLEEYTDKSQEVLPKNIALQITDILSDEQARIPTFGSRSALYFEGRQVAVKTGTTNNYKDTWAVGYTPSLVAGAWAGNNDNTPMEKKTSGLIIAPLWREFIEVALKDKPVEYFEKPNPLQNSNTVKPALKGLWQGGEHFFVDTISGGLATDKTPEETKKEKVITNVHSILYWVDKDNPLGPPPQNPYNDPQFTHWEIPIQNWWSKNSSKYPTTTMSQKPNFYDTIHTAEKAPFVTITNPTGSETYPENGTLSVVLDYKGSYPLKKVDYFINDTYIGSSSSTSFSVEFGTISDIKGTNDLKIIVTDSVFNTQEVHKNFNVQLN